MIEEIQKIFLVLENGGDETERACGRDKRERERERETEREGGGEREGERETDTYLCVPW